MATWQYALKIIPSNSEKGSAASWRHIRIPRDFIDTVSVVLPHKASWSENLEIYGNEASSCLELWLEAEEVVEIETRLDLRSLDERTVKVILDFTKNINGVFQDSDGKIFEPTMHELVNNIHSSRAYKFVQDPIRFLEDI